MTSHALQDSFDYLEALYQRPILPAAQVGLRRIEYLLGRLGRPHEQFRTVHVTGTCGKGSTATMIASILQASGYRTGLFRSPHMETYLERITVDSVSIGHDDWLSAFERVRLLADDMESGSASGYDLGRPSLFEMVWAMAALHFSEIQMDIAVVEVGVGGRLSPTNVLNPMVAVVTNVSIDHTNILGPTEIDIAREKSRIIKSGGASVTAVDQPEVLHVIRQQSRDVGSRLWVVNEDVTYMTFQHDLKGEVFDVHTPVRNHRQLSIPLLGLHQVINASTAVAVIDQLRTQGLEIPAEAVTNGLRTVEFPGRFEIVAHDPTIILDGARNVASAQVLRKTLDDLFQTRSVHLLIGVLGDKDAFGIVDELAGRATSATVTTPPWEGRIGNLSRLEDALRQHLEDVDYIEDVPSALVAVIARCPPEGVVLVTGSLYLVAVVRHLLISGRIPALP